MNCSLNMLSTNIEKLITIFVLWMVFVFKVSKTAGNPPVLHEYEGEASSSNQSPRIQPEKNKITQNNCLLSLPNKLEIRMPIPIMVNENRYSIMYPDDKERLFVQYGRSITLSCFTSTFALTELSNVNEVSVSCAGDDQLLYDGKIYKYDDFKCTSMPRNMLRVTEKKCQNGKYSVAEVGFPTKNVFLVLYNVCFDKSTKNSLYTWYATRSPFHIQLFTRRVRLGFRTTQELYGETDLDNIYSIPKQKEIIEAIIEPHKSAEMNTRQDYNHFLRHGHYAPRSVFFYAFEQSSTFYYANTAPQWQIFNGNLWSGVEFLVQRMVEMNTREDTSFVVVTGSYGLCKLQNREGYEKPLYLEPPTNIPVPLFFWKLVYNKRRPGESIVYVGLNNPFKKIDKSLILCENTCPGGYNDKGDGVYRDDDPESKREYEPWEYANKGLVYCCTKESFESFYGELDPIVFR